MCGLCRGVPRRVSSTSAVLLEWARQCRSRVVQFRCTRLRCTTLRVRLGTFEWWDSRGLFHVPRSVERNITRVPSTGSPFPAEFEAGQFVTVAFATFSFCTHLT